MVWPNAIKFWLITLLFVGYLFDETYLSDKLLKQSKWWKYKFLPEIFNVLQILKILFYNNLNVIILSQI